MAAIVERASAGRPPAPPHASLAGFGRNAPAVVSPRRTLGPVLLMVLAALPALRIETTGELPCELGTRLEKAALEQKLVVDAGAAHRLVVADAGDLLLVHVLDAAGHELGGRTLRPAQKDCAVLPRTVVLLAGTWLAARFPEAPVEAARDAGPPAPSPAPKTVRPPRAAEPVPDAGEPPELAVDAGEDAGVLAEAVVDAGPPDAGPPPDAGRPGATRRGEPADAGSPSVAPPRTFTLAVVGGAIFDLERPAGQVSAFADWGFFRALGALLELGLDSTRSASIPPGVITLQSYWLGIALRLAVIANLYASLGGRVFLMPVATIDFTFPASRTLWGGAFFASLDWRQPLIGPLFVIGRIGGQARIQAENIVVPGADGQLFLPVWSFFAHAGLGLKL